MNEIDVMRYNVQFENIKIMIIVNLFIVIFNFIIILILNRILKSIFNKYYFEFIKTI